MAKKTAQSRPTVISCAVFGGRSQRTGLRVGSRHRWDGGAWGKGRCEFCGRTLEQVQERSIAGASTEAHR